LIFGTLEWPLNFYFNFFDFNLFPSLLLITALFLLIFIPFLFLFSLGLRFLNRTGSTFGTVSRFVLLGVWFLALISLLLFGVNELRSHSVSATKTEKYELNLSESDTLFVSLKENAIAAQESFWEYDRSEILTDESGEHWWIGENFELNILKSKTPASYLEIKYEADGSNMKKAQNHAKEIIYDWQQKENQLVLDPIWKVVTSSRFQNQSVKLRLNVKEGQILNLDENLREVLSFPVKNDQKLRSHDTAGRLWIMGSEVLECLNCKDDQREFSLNYKSKEGEDKLRLSIDSQGIKIKTQ